MTDSPADSFGRFLAALLVAALPLVAVAQPVQLRPPSPIERPPPAEPQPNPQTGPVNGEPSPDRTPDSLPALQSPAAKTDIVVNTLEAVDPGAFGLIGPAGGGFAENLWQGTDWQFVKALIPRIPGTSSLGPIRSLSLRLLLSRAAVPEGKPSGESFLHLRADRLMAMGEADNALALLGALPATSGTEPLMQNIAELLFLQNSTVEACTHVQAATERFEGSYWNQARAFCLALEEKHERAALLAELLREQQDDIEPAFFDIIEALGGVKGIEIGSISRPGGLILSMMRVASLKLPSTLAQTEEPMILRWVARSPIAAIDDRLFAAEKSLLAGSLSAEEIYRIHSGTPVTDEALRNPISWAEANWTPRGRALLTRVASSQTTPLAAAEVLRRGLAIAEDKGNHTEFALSVSPAITGMTPGPELVWFAGDAARILFRAGDIPRALAWYDLAVAHREQVEEVASIEAELWPLAVLAGAESAVEALPDRLATWVSDRMENRETVRNILLFLSLVAEAGHEVPVSVLRGIVAGFGAGAYPAPGYAWQRLLSDSAANGRTGETVLLAITGATTQTGRAYPGPAITHAVGALRAIGLETDARRLALASALAAGL